MLEQSHLYLFLQLAFLEDHNNLLMLLTLMLHSEDPNYLLVSVVAGEAMELDGEE